MQFLLNVDWPADVLIHGSAVACGAKLQPDKVNEEGCEVDTGECGDEDGEDIGKPCRR